MNEIKAILSKLRFELGNTPKIIKRIDNQDFIPKPYKSVVLISADFELAWAWRYAKSSMDSYSMSIEKATQERKNVPEILKLCEKYNIPITWATVGHLFLESCQRHNGIAHAEIPKVHHYQGPFWDFSGNDWFEYDPCTNYQENNLWYCPDLVRQIIDSPVEHELANHTFSHIDCRDNICSPELFKAELRASKKIANEYGISLSSFVHPGHTIGNLDILKDEGFTNFRTDFRNVLGYPLKHENGLWEFEQTAEFNIRKEWSIDYHIYRYISILKRAIKSNTVAVFWFHPSFDAVIIEKIWPEVFRFMNEYRDTIWITTHREYVNWLDSRPDSE